MIISLQIKCSVLNKMFTVYLKSIFKLTLDIIIIEIRMLNKRVQSILKARLQRSPNLNDENILNAIILCARNFITCTFDQTNEYRLKVCKN